MARFTQERSPIKVFTPLEENTVLAVSLKGTETLGASYDFQVNLIAAKGTKVDFNALLGHEARVAVELPGGSERHYHGEIAEWSQGDSDEVFDHYSMVLRPKLARLGLTRRSRIFQNQSALDILKEILKPVGGAEYLINQTPPVRVYCTQYRETDLEFFLRLCSEEGITHYWKHTQEGHQLVLTDNSPIGPSVGEIAYDLTLGGTQRKPFFRSWKVTQSMSTTGAGILDHQFQLFGQKIEANANGPASIMAGDLSLTPSGSVAPWQEDNLSAARYFDGINGSGGQDSAALPQIYPAQERQGKILARGAASGSVRAWGIGNCCQVTPGHAFRLTSHANQNGDWLTVTASHDLELEGRFWAGETSSLRIEVTTESAPLSLVQAPWPPRQRPRLGGIETAIVTGPVGKETFVDPYGRIKVRFWFDRNGPTDGGSSCWVRVSQVSAGKNWGACFWPRVGHEVVVAFEGGDPDRPIVVGSVFNSLNMPPYTLPEHVYISGFKSSIEGGDPSKNFHQILMSDEKGSEVVHIHAEGALVSHQESQQFNMRPKLDFYLHGG